MLDSLEGCVRGEMFFDNGGSDFGVEVRIVRLY